MARQSHNAEGSAHLVLLTCGYGLFLAFYSTCAQWGSTSLATTAPAYGFFQPVIRWSIVCGYAASLLWGLRRHVGMGPLPRAVAGAAGICGLVLLAWVVGSTEAHPAPACLAAVLLGLGAATLNACWIDALRALAPAAAQTVLAAGTMCAGVICLAPEVLAFADATPPATAVAAAELAASLVLLVREAPRLDGGGAGRPAAPARSALAYVPALSVLTPALACGLVVPLLQPLAGMALADQTLPPLLHNLLWCAGEVVAGCVMLAVWRLRGPGVDTAEVFTLCLPVILTVAVLFPFLGASYWPLLLLFSEVLRSIVLVSAVAACLRVANTHGLSPVVPYCVIALLMFLADLAACALGPLVVSVTPAATDRARLAGVLFSFALACTLLVAAFARRGRTGRPEARTGVVQTPANGGRPTAGATSPTVPGTAPDALGQACLRVAAGFGLSAREAEVLELQARGRNVPYIAQELGVSQATVRSHVKRIHQALDVHTQQELIGFVEMH